MQQLQKVNPVTLKPGDIVFVDIQDNRNGFYRNKHHGTVIMLHETNATIEFDGPNNRHLIFYTDMYVPKQSEPVLIELEKVKEYMDKHPATRSHALKIHFSKPENQYNPKQPVEEKKYSLDEVKLITKRLGCQLRSHEEMQVVIDTQKAIDKIYQNKYSVSIPWNVQMSDSEANERTAAVFGKHIFKAPIIVMEPDATIQHPFDLSTAKELYKQSGAAQELAMRYYDLSQLLEKEPEKVLPMTFDDLETINGYFINNFSELGHLTGIAARKDNRNIYPTREHAEAALAMAQLLQLRQTWLNIEAPGWVPDWNTNETKYGLDRFKDSIIVGNYANIYIPLSFPTLDLADKFKDSFESLLKTAFCLQVG